MNENCVFCKIIKGEIPSHTVFEDDFFKIILDINPAAAGHMLVISKEHAANVFELSDEAGARLFPLLKRAAKVLSDTVEAHGVNILQNNGDAAGQTVFHFHAHIIPRYIKDGVRFEWEKTENDSGSFLVMSRILAEKLA